MKIKYLSLVVASALSADVAVESKKNLSDTVKDAFENAKVSGEWRTFYINRVRSGAIGDTQDDTQAFSTGGHLKMETAPVGGLSMGIGFYTTQSLLPKNVDDGTGKDDDFVREPSMYNDDRDGYSVLGEAYLKYLTDSGNSLTVGNMKIKTPLAGSDDVRMTPNLFRGALFSTPHIPDSTLLVGHFTHFMAGSFSNVYWAPSAAMNADGSPTWKGLLQLSGGYGIKNNSAKFMNMGDYAIGKKTDGVSTVGFINSKSVENLKLQAWNYMAHDILNATYLQADYKMKLNDDVTAFASGQLINEMSIGDEFAGEIESMFVAGKAGATAYGLTVYGVYSQTGSSDDKLGAIISPWGGIPAFNQGMVARHMFFEDTTAWKVGAKYDLRKYAGKNGSIAGYYASYDMGENNNIMANHSWTSKEAGFDIICKPEKIKNLTLRLRGNFPTEFVETSDGRDLDWAEYRAIASYKF